MLTTFVVLSIILACAAQQTDPPGTSQPEITSCLTPVCYCMIIDSSNSIFKNKGDRLWDQEKQVIRNIVQGFDIGPGPDKSKVSLVKYGRQVFREFDFRINTNKSAVLRAIAATQRIPKETPGGTATPDAILECLKIFKEKNQTSVPKVIMVFTDGVTHYVGNSDVEEKQKLTDAANQSRQEGTINYAVMFVNDSTKIKRAQEEASIITDMSADRTFVNTTLDALEKQITEELACVCSVRADNGTITAYAIGETVPNKDSCLNCTCVADENITCINISLTCPPPACAQGYVPMRAAAPGDECCAYVCEPFCSLTSCVNGGLCCAEAMRCVCPPGYTGERCEKCVYAGTEYDMGETIVTANPCRRCICGPSWMDNCYTINCPTCPEGEKEVNRTFVPEECCPQFECEPPCIIGGTGYGVGDTIPLDPDHPCEDKCVCGADGKRTCTVKECPELDCDQSRQRTVPGECCPRCIEPPCDIPSHYCMIADSSRSMFFPQVEGLWDDLKRVIRTVVSSLPIGPGRRDSKVALVKYAAYLEAQGKRQIEREFTFQDNTNKHSVLDDISAMIPIDFEEGPGNGGTATPEAIKECLAVFNEQSSAEVPKFIVVFTDGVTHYFNVTEDVAQQRLKEAVQDATAAGVTNYGVVFIGNNRTEEAMEESIIIAQEVDDRAFYGGSLEEIQDDIIIALNCESEE